MSVKEVEDTVKIPYVLGNTDTEVQDQCIHKFEGKCGKHGYVIPGSLRISNRSPPIHVVGSGEMMIHICYKCKVGIFKTGDILDIVINQITPGIGSLGFVMVDDVKIGTIILPEDLQTKKSEYSTNDMVRVKILTSTYGYGWENIRGVGQII